MSAKTEEFIRDSSGIHPEFIGQSASYVLILRAAGAKTRPSAVGQGLSASDPKLDDPTNQEEVAIEGIPGARTLTGPAPEEAGWASHPPFWRSPRKADAALESSRHHSHE